MNPHVMEKHVNFKWHPWSREECSLKSHLSVSKELLPWCSCMNLSVKCLGAFGDGGCKRKAITSHRSPPPPPEFFGGSWSWEFIPYASSCWIRRETKISQVTFPLRSWWSYWLSVDINCTGYLNRQSIIFSVLHSFHNSSWISPCNFS